MTKNKTLVDYGGNIIKKVVIVCPVLKKEVVTEYKYAFANSGGGDEYELGWVYATITVHCECGKEHQINIYDA